MELFEETVRTAVYKFNICFKMVDLPSSNYSIEVPHGIYSLRGQSSRYGFNYDHKNSVN